MKETIPMKYHEAKMYSVGDIIDRKGDKYVVASITLGYENEIEVISLREFIERNQYVLIDGEYITIYDYVTEQMDKYLNM